MNENLAAPSPDRQDTPADLQAELSELEYFASQRQLDADESRRLAELRQISGRIAGSAVKDAARAVPGSPVVSGDDSPA